MIIARAPLRISFAGGGTDLPAFYERYGPGAVVSTTINKYVYVTLNEKFDGKVSVRYRIHENTDSVRELKHPLIREILLHYGIERNVELVVISDVPARGSGLGASSALAVALCAALRVHTTGEFFKSPEVSKMASMIEIEKVGSPIGKQDHYASELGGMNLIRFERDDSVNWKRFSSEEFIREIESQSMLFYLNMEHEYQGGHFVQKILKGQLAEVEEKRRIYELQRDNAAGLWEHMAYEVPERFIDHVNENWRLKRSLHPDISNPRIEETIQRAFASGATAAKVCGAGGGGFIYLIVPSIMQEDVRKALSDLIELRFKFESEGVKIIHSDHQDELAHAS